MTAKDILKEPITIAVALAGAVGHALGIGPITTVVGVLWTQISTLFTALSVAGLTLAPQVPWLPAGPLTTAALIAGGAYVLKLLDQIVDRIQMRLD